jgi:hypothetical protein
MYSMLPNFIHAGVPKAASKTIQMIFQKHPDIYVPKIKEQNYFLDDNLYSRGINWYRQFFYKNTGYAKAIGDLSIGYSSGLAVNVPKRIFETLGKDIKLIFVFRQPVDRAYSNYCMARYKGLIETLEFDEAIRRALSVFNTYGIEDINRIKNGTYYINKKDMDIYRSCVYLDTGLYSKIINRFKEYYKKENMLLLFFDDFINNGQDEANKIFDFLGVNRINIDFSQKYNESTKLKYPFIKKIANSFYKSSYVRRLINDKLSIKLRGKLKKSVFGFNYIPHKYPDIRLETSTVLQRFYIKDIKELENIANRDLSSWKRKYSVN